MSALTVLNGITTPVLVTAAVERAGVRFLGFFTSGIPNPGTRRAYLRVRQTESIRRGRHLVVLA